MIIWMIISKSERKNRRVLTTQERCEEKNKWKRRKNVVKDWMTTLKEKTSKEENWRRQLNKRIESYFWKIIIRRKYWRRKRKRKYRRGT